MGSRATVRIGKTESSQKNSGSQEDVLKGEETESGNLIYKLSAAVGAGIIEYALRICRGGDVVVHPGYPLRIEVREPLGSGGGKTFDVFRDGKCQGPCSGNVKAAAAIFIQASPKW